MTWKACHKSCGKLFIATVTVSARGIPLVEVRKAGLSAGNVVRKLLNLRDNLRLDA